MLPIVAWINLAAGLIAAAVAISEEMFALSFGLAVAALTLFAVLQALDRIVGQLKSINYHLKRK
ncbi:hypothetical protein [Salipiger mucosus]|uniref:Uncharacterized protein n=1 Tax=Salipiger mucosus DSM 16094 TaxID=1123237 RepID=S9QR33_9RHOB|nr:hypothetical protein [Salipiger mucosus]EPX82087.1 hypothetical protein Salmuc_02455 [Salipiger mucosus DSM 16094]